MPPVIHSKRCICEDCYDRNLHIDCDDTPKFIDGQICKPIMVCMVSEGVTIVSYYNENQQSFDIELSEWETYPNIG